jgi:hypothetical protein
MDTHTDFELSEVMDTMNINVNYIDLPIEKQTFCKIMQGNGERESVAPVSL